MTVLAYLAEFIKIKLTLEDVTDVDGATKHFGRAIAGAAPAVPGITVYGFCLAAPDHGVLHCKMVITDEKRAVVVGSPFSQRYFDSLVHRIDDAHRGSNTSDLVHDLSIAVVGQAARSGLPGSPMPLTRHRPSRSAIALTRGPALRRQRCFLIAGWS